MRCLLLALPEDRHRVESRLQVRLYHGDAVSDSVTANIYKSVKNAMLKCEYIVVMAQRAFAYLRYYRSDVLPNLPPSPTLASDQHPAPTERPNQRQHQHQHQQHPLLSCILKLSIFFPQAAVQQSSTPPPPIARAFSVPHRNSPNHLTACKNALSFANLCSPLLTSALTANPCGVPEYKLTMYSLPVCFSSASISALLLGSSILSFSACATDTGPWMARISSSSRRLGWAVNAASTLCSGERESSRKRKAYFPPKQ